MRILFISHSYPPIVGGVESQNYNLSKNLSRIASVTVIANSQGKKVLPFFLVYSLLRSLITMHKYDVCLCGNGVLAPIAQILKFYYPRKRFYCIVHGLDITFADRKGVLPFLYRNLNLLSLRKLDKLFMVGNSTIKQAVKHDIPEKICYFIPNGVDAGDFIEDHTRKELAELLGISIEEKKVLLRLGRFVKHKGTSWFIENVMPLLPEHFILVAAGNRVSARVAGDKDDFVTCQKAIESNHLQERVFLFPSIPQPKLRILLNTVDLVVSPNIKVPGTMEGFGINVIEAGSCGRVVMASDIEGLADAIKNGKNGILVPPSVTSLWIKKIIAVFDAGDDFIESFGSRTADYVRTNYSWKKIAQRYLEEMKDKKIDK